MSRELTAHVPTLEEVDKVLTQKNPSPNVGDYYKDESGNLYQVKQILDDIIEFDFIDTTGKGEYKSMKQFPLKGNVRYLSLKYTPESSSKFLTLQDLTKVEDIELIHSVGSPPLPIHAPKSVPKETNPLDTQVGGNHYKSLPIQVVEYNFFNDIPYMEGNIIKYITRWRTKNGIQDLEKAKHYIELLIELEKRKQQKDENSLPF